MPTQNHTERSDSMRMFKVTTPVSVMSRRFMRSFERSETVSEAELELVIAQIRTCFEENASGTAEAAASLPEA